VALWRGLLSTGADVSAGENVRCPRVRDRPPAQKRGRFVRKDNPMRRARLTPPINATAWSVVLYLGAVVAGTVCFASA
jgi:hypothetical protein